MRKAIIEAGNSRAQVRDLDTSMFRLLSHELAYPEGEPSERRFIQRDGSVKTTYWDGFRRLLSPKGTFPTGLVARTCRLLTKWGVAFQLVDRRTRPAEQLPMWSAPATFRLRDYQERAVNQAFKWGRGVIDSPPRTGKTIMMAELVRRVSLPTVITSPTIPIAQQTHGKLLELFRDQDWARQRADCSEDFYLMAGGQPKTPEQIQACGRATVFVATATTAAMMPASWWERIACLITDERHHQAADTYRDINDLAVNAYYRWGFTGTNYRSDPGEQVALECCLGRTLVQYSIGEMTDRGVLVPGRVEFWPIDMKGIRSAPFQDAYRAGIVDCDIRNQAILYAAGQLQREGRRVLILVHEIEHGERLARLITGSVFVKGADGPDVRRAVELLDRGKIRCLIGSPVVGEGLDCPSADALIYAKARKARVTHTQDTFRIMTANAAKRDALIVDFADRHNRTLMDHSVERMHNYQAMGMQVKVHAQLPIDLFQPTLY